MRLFAYVLLLPAAWLAGPVSIAHAQDRLADAAPPEARWKDFDAYVQAVQKQFDVPGVAVAILQDGNVVLERGYGVRELGKAEKVDADTLFAIASNTKAFTATALRMLAEEGKLSMDDRVIDHLPWFRMSDPYVTQEMRLRDLLAHRSGLSLGAGDLLYWPETGYSTREVAERLKDVPLTGGFRARYAYDNILYGVAQLVIEQASGQSYRDFLRARIWQPLGMQRTRFNSDELGDIDNIAVGHAKFDFKELRPVPRMAWRNVSGAGGIYSSVRDMSQWMRMQLNGGAIFGQSVQARLFSEDSQRQMWSIITPIPIVKPAVPELTPTVPNFAGYGEGWNLSDYRGEKLVWHTGGWPGMVSRVTLIPGRKMGVVVLTNQEVGAAFHAITYRALDTLLGAPEYDWIGAYAAAVAKAQSGADEDWAKHLAARAAASAPSLPVSDYAGTYRDPWYGDVVIRQGQRGLEMQFAKTPQLLGDLQHWQHDSFIVRWRDRGLNADAFVSFALDQDGKIREARMQPISPLTDFSFDFQDLRLTPARAESSKK